MREAASFAVLVAVVAGFIVWASALTTVYALFSLGCIQGWETPRPFGLPSWHAATAAGWLAHIVAHAALIAWTVRRFRAAPAAEPDTRRFLEVSAVVIAILGLVATLWTGAPIALLSTCA